MKKFLTTLSAAIDLIYRTTKREHWMQRHVAAGRIVENGSFDELVAQGGIFANLVKRQTA